MVADAALAGEGLALFDADAEVVEVILQEYIAAGLGPNDGGVDFDKWVGRDVGRVADERDSAVCTWIDSDEDGHGTISPFRVTMFGFRTLCSVSAPVFSGTLFALGKMNGCSDNGAAFTLSMKARISAAPMVLIVRPSGARFTPNMPGSWSSWGMLSLVSAPLTGWTKSARNR